MSPSLHSGCPQSDLRRHAGICLDADMKINCILRHMVATGSRAVRLATFLWQTAGRNAEMVVYQPARSAAAFRPSQGARRQRATPAGGMREIENRAFELASDDADLVHKWDDDDLYLPWFLEDGLGGIGGARAWKVAEALMWDELGTVRRSSNWLKSTWLIGGAFPPPSRCPGIRRLGHPLYPALAASGDVVAPVRSAAPFVYTSGRVRPARFSEVGSWLSFEERELAILRFTARRSGCPSRWLDGRPRYASGARAACCRYRQGSGRRWAPPTAPRSRTGSEAEHRTAIASVRFGSATSAKTPATQGPTSARVKNGLRAVPPTPCRSAGHRGPAPRTAIYCRARIASPTTGRWFSSASA